MRGAALLLLGLASVGCERTPVGGQPSTSSSSTSSVVTMVPGHHELLGDLAPGAALGPVQVEFIGAVQRGRIPIRVHKGDAVGTIELLLQGAGPLPPVSTAKYALFYTSPRPGTPALSSPDLVAACEALAARIRPLEATTPPPEGLTSYGTPSQDL